MKPWAAQATPAGSGRASGSRRTVTGPDPAPKKWISCDGDNSLLVEYIPCCGIYSRVEYLPAMFVEIPQHVCRTMA